ncbi:MAG: sulfur carrier protein ThiS [Bacteroidales bacterium]|nr:sulfur carrier protein ThiS [Bacteroidales bacterium]
MIKIMLNDQPMEIEAGTTLAQLIASEEIRPTGIATAINNKVVPQDKRETTVLNDGDNILIIKAFCGG